MAGLHGYPAYWQCLLFPCRLATTSLTVPTLSPLTKPASLPATSARSSSGHTMNRSTSQAFWSECPGEPQVARAAWQPPAPCWHTGLGDANVSGVTLLLAATQYPSMEVHSSCNGCQPTVLLLLAPHRTYSQLWWWGGPQPTLQSPLMPLMRGCILSTSTLPSAGQLPLLQQPLPHPSCSQKLPARALAGVFSGLVLLVVKDKHWLRANSWLGCLLADSRISCPRSTSSRKGSARSSWYVQGGLLRPGLLVPPCQRLRLLLSLEATRGSLVGEKQEQEAVGGHTRQLLRSQRSEGCCSRGRGCRWGEESLERL